jgi:hypothetical protein
VLTVSTSSSSGALKKTVGHVKLCFKEIVGNKGVTRLLIKCSFMSELCVTDENAIYISVHGQKGEECKPPICPLP